MFLSGKCGIQITVYSKERDDASLPCDHVAHEDCSTTTWIYSSTGGAVVEMVGHGKIQLYSNRTDRLTVGFDCSLKISNVTSQDAGEYRCQQYLTEGGPLHGEDALVYLSVLTGVSSSSFRPAPFPFELT